MPLLFDRLRAGDPKAPAEVLQYLRTFAKIVIRSRGPAGWAMMDADDLAQEAARRFFAGGLSRFRGQGSEKSYLYSMVKLTALELGRAAARRSRREDAVAERAVHDERVPTEDPLLRLTVGAVLARLSDACRTLLVRVFLDDVSYADLAGELGLEQSSVRARVSRCIKRAREMGSGGSAA